MKKILLTSLLFCIPAIAFAQSWAATYNPNLTQTISQYNTATYGTAQPGAGQIPLNGNLSYQSLEPLPTSFGGTGQYTNLADYLRTVYPLVITIGSLIAVVILTIAGVRYMLGFSEGQLDNARRQIRNALWGLAVLVGSFLVVYTLNPDLLKFNFNPQTVTIGANQSGLPTSALGNTPPVPGTVDDLVNRERSALTQGQNSTPDQCQSDLQQLQSMPNIPNGGCQNAATTLAQYTACTDNFNVQRALVASCVGNGKLPSSTQY